MSVKIRLTRIGRKNQAKYRIVAMEEGKKRDGGYIDLLGFYDPIPAKPQITLNKEKIIKWLKNGARLSDGCHKLLKKQLSELKT